MRSSIAILYLVATAPLALADVAFISPAAAAIIPGGTSFTITWKDSGDAPSISDLSGYTLTLFAGSNTSPQPLYSFPAGSFSAGNTLTATIPVGIGASTKNAYFLGMLSTATAGGTVTNYSNRFTLSGMTGTFSTVITSGLAGLSSTVGPATVNNVAAAAPPAAPGATDEGAWGTPYNEQEGLTRYAPMQPAPPTAITATNTAPLWPTSSVVLASTFLPIASIVTTLTQANTFSVPSHANTGAPASQPTDDMQRFLNRWKD